MLPFDASYGIIIRHKQTNEYMLVKSKTRNEIFWRNLISRWHYSFDSRACRVVVRDRNKQESNNHVWLWLRISMPKENNLLLCCCHVPSIVGKCALFCALAYLVTLNSLSHSCFGLVTVTTTHTPQLRTQLRHNRTIPYTINTSRRNNAAFQIISKH